MLALFRLVTRFRSGLACEVSPAETSSAGPAGVPRLSRLAVPSVPTAIAVVVVTLVMWMTYSVAVKYVCANHTGSMYKMALDVSEGQVLYRDTYSQYGPLPTWLHALGLLAFGKRVVVITMVTGAFLAGAYWLLYRVWSRVVDRWAAAVATAAVAAFVPYAGLPWPNYFLTFFIALACYCVARQLEGGGGWWSFAAGLALGGGVLCRQQGLLGVGAFGAFFGLHALATRRRPGAAARELARFAGPMAAGVGVVVGGFFSWLWTTGAYADWYLQTVRIVGVAYGRYNGSPVEGALETWRGMLAGLFFQTADPLYQLPHGAPKVWAFLALTVSLFAAAPGLRWVTGRPYTREDAVAALLGWAALFGWTQGYPLPDDFRFALGFAPAFGLFALMFWGSALRNVAPPVGAAALAAGFTVLFWAYLPSRWPLHPMEPWATEGLVRVDYPEDLRGIYLAPDEAQFYADLHAVLSQYEGIFPGTPMVTTGVEPLMLTLVRNHENFHPMVFSWWSQKGYMAEGGEAHTINALLYPDYLARREAYIREKKPLVLNYGEPRQGYTPIFANTGVRPADFANQWALSPVITLQAPDDRASEFHARFGRVAIKTPAGSTPLRAAVRALDPHLADPACSAENLADGSAAKFWAAHAPLPGPGRSRLEFDLGAPRPLGVIEFRHRPGYPQYFPEELDVDGSPDGVAWVPLARVSGHRHGEADRLTVRAPAETPPVRYVRVAAVHRPYPSADAPQWYTLQLAEVSFYARD